uniref:Myb/SANT-like domain-containing protein n=1 Tax=Gossypium raimondii TaxID=29730 RepID=A0A0D2RNW0_GOSRA|nr:hypothetical protein B456_011G173800 [Gossypium raimondii]
MVYSSVCWVSATKDHVRSGTHFTKDGWLKIMTNFEKETSKAFPQKQLKNRWDALKKNRKLGRNLKAKILVVPKAQKFRTSGINPQFEGKLDQMFMGIVAIGDTAWAPSSIKKEKNPEISSSHFKTKRKKSSKQIGGAARLSSQIEKLCNAADNMSQATSSLTPVMDPYGIPQAVKVLDSMSKEVLEASPLYFFALKLLLNKDKRVAFLTINPKIRALWLKTEMKDS